MRYTNRRLLYFTLHMNTKIVLFAALRYASVFCAIAISVRLSVCQSRRSIKIMAQPIITQSMSRDSTLSLDFSTSKTFGNFQVATIEI